MLIIPNEAKMLRKLNSAIYVQIIELDKDKKNIQNEI